MKKCFVIVEHPNEIDVTVYEVNIEDNQGLNDARKKVQKRFGNPYYRHTYFDNIRRKYRTMLCIKEGSYYAYKASYNLADLCKDPSKCKPELFE